VAGTALLLGRQALYVLFVVGFDVLFWQLQGFGQACCIEHQVLHISGLLGAESFGLRLVKLFKIGIGHLDFGNMAGRHKPLDLDFSSLQKSLQSHLALPLCGHGRGLKCRQYLLPGQITTDLGLQHLGRHALAGGQLTVSVHVQFAIGATQTGNRGVLPKVVGQALVAGHEDLFF